jgi:hypothetical protein
MRHSFARCELGPSTLPMTMSPMAYGHMQRLQLGNAVATQMSCKLARLEDHSLHARYGRAATACIYKQIYYMCMLHRAVQAHDHQ